MHLQAANIRVRTNCTKALKRQGICSLILIIMDSIRECVIILMIIFLSICIQGWISVNRRI